MEKVLEELDEAKAEIENLKVELKIKVELSESLKRAHNEQLTKIQEAKAKTEKQAQELNEKEDEISITKKNYNELKSRMKEKEATIKYLSSAIDKLHMNCDENRRKWEEETRELAMALDDANSRNMDQEQQLHAYKEEVKDLKSLLSASEKKCVEAGKKAKVTKELRQRDDLLLKLEESNGKVENQLKWKKEQFEHLEEAHEKLKGQFQASKKEWEVEKSTLLDEISTLETNLDSQTRILEDLQSRLQMCNQALAHEESRRKYLEVQLSETKTCFNNVFAECQEAKSKIECLTDQRDKDIASLRDLLGTKEMLHKEMQYQLERLEQENKELHLSLKELREPHIQEAGTSSSLLKLRNKLKALENMHRDCSKYLRAKEAEWTSRLEKMSGELTDCKSELESKDTVIKEFKKELETCRSLIMHLGLQNEEQSFMLLLLKSGINEARLKLADEMANMNLENSQREEKVSLLIEQLDMKSTALAKAQRNIEEQSTEMGYLLRRVESLSLIEQQQLQLQDELVRQKEMLKETAKSQLCLKEQALQMMESDLRKAHDALNRANNELDEKFCEGNELEFELQIWKSIAEHLKANLEENQQTRRQLEVSLLAEVEVEFTLKQEKESLAHDLEEKERTLEDLQRQLILFDGKLEKESLLPSTKEEERISNGLHKEIESLEEDSVRRELEGATLAHIFAERTYEHEKDYFQRLLDERGKKIDDLHQLLMSMEERFKSVTLSLSSQLAEKQAELNLLQETWDEIGTAQALKEVEIQEKTLVIAELEDEFTNFQKKLQSQQKNLSSLREEREAMAADLKAKQLEIKKLSSDLRTSDTIVEKLETEKRSLLEDVKKLSSQRESVLDFVGSLLDRLTELSLEDIQLMGIWEKIMQNFDDDSIGMALKGSDDPFDPLKENMVFHYSHPIKRGESTVHERLPFRALNN
ncbi:uncharacterized protein At4g38062 [Diospyros lotus]|uniref:uncharacterized protein At4g38062 n=1 Tax=Diospyros lotus TaxID=55363 RepID=UPI0022555961|nr:uncharacterized protein At4g38062 [Diospyros lotus]XP_052195156.1 uncharacterized protein At4g38062 [Diospyros lotus]XP_052195157.1 uncharacterized protein At4g38062 [Diospyros lotus]